MKYRAITSENFYYKELKNTAILLKETQVPFEDAKELIREKDVLDTKSIANFNKKFLSINKRYNALSEELRVMLCEADSENGKFINFYAILLAERIVLEFMDEVVRENFSRLNYQLSNSDFISFMKHKQEQSEDVASWTQAGRDKVITKLKNFSVEAGYLEKNNDGFLIKKPVIDTSIINAIENQSGSKFLKILLY